MKFLSLFSNLTRQLESLNHANQSYQAQSYPFLAVGLVGGPISILRGSTSLNYGRGVYVRHSYMDMVRVDAAASISSIRTGECFFFVRRAKINTEGFSLWKMFPALLQTDFGESLIY